VNGDRGLKIQSWQGARTARAGIRRIFGLGGLVFLRKSKRLLRTGLSKTSLGLVQLRVRTSAGLQTANARKLNNLDCGLMRTEIKPRDMRVTRCCLLCETPFEYLRSRLAGRERLFCSETCRKSRLKAQNARYRIERRYRARPRAKSHRKLCVVCDNPFYTANLRTQCCGGDCGAILGKRRGDIARARNAQIRNRRLCRHCGSLFVKVRGSLGLYCSRKCAGVASGRLRAKARANFV
jgi:hypothetical protein